MKNPAEGQENPRVNSWAVAFRDKLHHAALAACFMLSPLLLSGCAHMEGWAHNNFKVGPNYFKPAVPVAEDWIDFNDRRVISDPEIDWAWWQVFGDQSLDSLVQSSFQENLTVRTAGLRVLEAQAQRAYAVGNLFPQAQDAMGSYKHLQLSEAGNAAGVAPTSRSFDLWNVGTGLSWELDIWGKFRRRIEQQDAQLDREVEKYDDVLLLTLAETSLAYVDLREAQQRTRLAEQNVRLQQETLRIAEERFESGAVRKIDVTMARSNLSETQAMVPLLNAQARQANNRLCLLTGQPPRDLTQELGQASIPQAPPSVVLGIPADLVRRRPDIRASEREVARRSADIGIATADLFPEFSIDGSLGWTASQVPDLFTPAAFGGIVGPSFRWRILNYGRIQNNIRAKDASFQQAAVEYQHTVLRAQEEAESALTHFLNAQARAKELGDAVKASEESLELLTTLYKEGKEGLTPLFLMERLLVRQQDELAGSQAEIARSLIRVYKALGGGWEIRLGGSSPIYMEAIEPPDGETIDPIRLPRVDNTGDPVSVVPVRTLDNSTAATTRRTIS
jgi:NodT family efflux transporter outer membrane factor (OMF) lipoprotein